MKTSLSAIVFSVAIVIAAIFLGNAYKNRTKADGNITVTGLGEKDFLSDLIVWEGNFSKANKDLKQAYNDLETDRKIIDDYLKSNGINPKDVVFNAVQTREDFKSTFSNEGRVTGQVFEAYVLTQSIQISSKEVEKVENIARKITELLNKGIQFYSEPPRYYYSKLADLKIELISKATEDARIRAEMIAEKSGGRIDRLESAQMGIFQITGQYSTEEYSWGGTFNTASKEKRASITMKLTYRLN